MWNEFQGEDFRGKLDAEGRAGELDAEGRADELDADGRADELDAVGHLFSVWLSEELPCGNFFPHPLEFGHLIISLFLSFFLLLLSFLSPSHLRPAQAPPATRGKKIC